MNKSRRPTTAFLLLLAAGLALYVIMLRLQPHLPSVLFDYSTWDAGRTDHFLWRVLWLIGDGTEPHFSKTVLGGVGLLAGGWLAYWLDRRQSRARGTPVGYGSGSLWPWVFACMLLSLGIAVAIFGGLHVDGDTYVPTYVTFVSVSGAVIFLYGGSIPVLLTGSLFSALTTVPVAIWMRNVLCLPNGFPGVLATVGGMCVGGIFTFEICKVLPWMHLDHPIRSMPSQHISGELEMSAYKRRYPARFFFRRILCDLSEPVYMANEWPGIFLIVGSLVSWALNPLHPYYGTGLFPQLVLNQVITAGLAVYLYWDQWMEKDFYATFLPVVSVGPACILQFGGSLPVVIISAVLGAIFCPPMAEMVNRKIPAHWHAMVGLTFSMCVSSFLAVIMIRYLSMAIPGIC